MSSRWAKSGSSSLAGRPRLGPVANLEARYVTDRHFLLFHRCFGGAGHRVHNLGDATAELHGPGRGRNEFRVKQHQNLTRPKYRADIDGLRAISVLSVIGFHAFPFFVKDGFVGVDIFFVISGFLISTIIFENLARDSFSFLEFYRRRIKRIFPALVVVLTACMIIGWFELLPDEYQQLGQHVATGAGFVSNFQLWRENGYFDAGAETKPLLHLWSLGIEEQFYLVWPVLLWLAWKQKINLLLTITTIVAVSFGLNVWLVRNDAAASFYSPETRFWELLIGSALAYGAVFEPETMQRLTLHPNIQAWLGVGLLIACFLLVTRSSAFPGWWALLPTLGGALLISAGSKAWFNRKVLSNPVLVWFGCISFPLYLWHWPLLSFLRINQFDPNHLLRIAVVALSIVLAWATYQLVERPIRFGKLRDQPAYALSAALILVGSSGYLIMLQKGLPGYGARGADISAFAAYFENSPPGWKYFQANGIRDKYRFDCDFYDGEKYRIGKATTVPVPAISKSCYERTPHSEKAVLIWGDSHAQQLYYGLKQNLPEWDVLIVASSGCKPNLLANEDSVSNFCQRSNWFALKTIKEARPGVVIVAQSDGHDFEEFMNIGNLLKKEEVKKVIFIGPTPHWVWDLPKVILRYLWKGTPERTFVGIDDRIMAQNKRLKESFSTQSDFIFVDLINFFCSREGCLTRIGTDKTTGITSRDYGHLTPIASDYLAKELLAKIVSDDK
jgi:peptidoglycan/LPS O-acetylase OafA/YrhL